MYGKLVAPWRSVLGWYLRHRRLVWLLLIAALMAYSYTRLPPRGTLTGNHGSARIEWGGVDAGLPKATLYNIIGGRTVYYIGVFEYTSIYRINGTHYLYTHPEGLGLLVVVGRPSDRLFVLTERYNTSIRVNGMTYNVSRVTLVLPPAPPARTLPFKSVICAHVSSYTRSYDAFVHHALPAAYLAVCIGSSK